MTDPATRWQRATMLFEQWLAAAPADRPALLAAACGDDDALRAEVDVLLRGHAAATPAFLEPPATARLTQGHSGQAESLYPDLLSGSQPCTFSTASWQRAQCCDCSVLPSSLT